MPDKKKKKKNDVFTLQEGNELSITTGYINESAVKNATVESATTVCSTDGKKELNNERPLIDENFNYSDDQREKLVYEFSITPELKDEYKYLENFSLSSIRERLKDGELLSDIYKSMKTFITDNKDSNPDMVQIAVSQLLADAKEHYDNCVHTADLNILVKKEGYHRKNLGRNAQEILEKISELEQGEELHGLVCSTISEFGMRILDECGIPAVMISGGTGGSNHTTLLWQRSDGKFVQNNYGDSYILNASNIKDAAREIYKDGLGLINNGYIYFVDNDGSYQEFAMKDEAVWGAELDKRAYNNEGIFDHTPAKASSITGVANVSNLGSVQAEVNATYAYQNAAGDRRKETTFSFGFKKSGVTSLADSSIGIGGKVEHKTEKLTETGRTYSESKVVFDLTKLHTGDFKINSTVIRQLNCVKVNNQEDMDVLREWFEKEYEHGVKEYLPGDIRNQQKYSDYLENYESRPEPNNEAKEEYISDYLARQTLNKLHYDELDDKGKKTLEDWANDSWLEHLVGWGYKGASEYAEKELDYYTQRIKLYSDKDSFIQTMINESCGAGSKDYKYESDVKSYDTYNFTAFIRKVFGKEKVLFSDKNKELTTATQISGTFGLNDVLLVSDRWDKDKSLETNFLSFGADLRVAAEKGYKLDISDGNTYSSSNVSAGVLADLSLKNGTLTTTVSPGIKLNGSTTLQGAVNQNLTLGAGINGYAVVTRPSVDWGCGAQASASYKPNNSTATIFAAADASIEKQRLRIGGFNALAEDGVKIGAAVGVNFKSGLNTKLSYYRSVDKMNSTRNRSMISLSASMSF